MSIAKAAFESDLPHVPVANKPRSQLESFLVLRRNVLELWGEPAYEKDILPGKFLGRTQIMLNNPAAIRHVLVNNADNYERNASTQRILKPLLGDGLFMATGDAWRHQRRTIAPSMAPRMMPVLADHVMVSAEQTAAALAGKYGAVMLLEVLQSLALRIAAQSMFSLEADVFGPRLRDKIVEYGFKFSQPGLFDLLLPVQFASPQDRGRARFRVGWVKLMDEIIDLREAKGRSEEARDLFDALAAARDPETGAGFNRAQLRDEISTMILAGHETTATALFWASLVSARYPEMQERIAVEADAADFSPGHAHDALKGLVFTRAFIDEVLRLYPPAFLILRIARKEDEICGHKIEAGTQVNISPWVLHRHKAHWADPERFNPERFMPGVPPPERFTYLPFGAGPRICVGAQFALTEAVLSLARLLRDFNFELIGGEDVRPMGRVTTQPDRPVPFLVTPRRINC